MLPSTIREPPRTEDFTSLAEHQEATPAVFFAGKPVLHHLVRGTTATVARSQCDGSLAIFPADAGREGQDESASASERPVERIVDVFVTSDTLILFAPSQEIGVAIPYPAIAIHAIKTIDQPSPSSSSSSSTSSNERIPAVWMQLELWNGPDNDEGDPVELTLCLPASSPETMPTPTPTPHERIQTLYDAITACAELHPDPDDSDSEAPADDMERIVFERGGSRLAGMSGAWMLGGGDWDDDGLPPPMPGSSGWITAENVDSFFDKDGNWIGGDDDEEVDVEIVEAEDEGEMDKAAGRVRDRDAVEREEQEAAEEQGETVTNGVQEVESKRQRV